MPDSNLIDWLLEASTASIRYFTRLLLLNQKETHPEVQAEMHRLTSSGPIPAILEVQSSQGNWHGEHSYYTPKYTSTHWSMLLMAELGLPGDHPPYQHGANYMLHATEGELEQSLRSGSHGLACFWGNLLRYAARCSTLDANRLKPMVEYLAREALESNWICPHNDGLSCAWGAARATWALAGIPATLRSDTVASAIDRALEFLLVQHDLTEANYPTSGKAHRLWFRLNHPLFYQVDMLFILRVLAEVGRLDHPGAQGALNWLKDRMTSPGRWRGANPYRQRTWKELGDRGETDQWVSLYSAWILQQYEG